MKNAILVFSLLIHVLVSAQTNDVRWGELKGKSGSLINILPISGDDFFTLSYSGGKSVGSYRLTHHVDFETYASGKIVKKAANGIANFEDVKVLNNKIYVFLSDKFNGESQFYIQEYDSEAEPIGEAKEIANFSLGKTVNKGFFNVITSRDNKYLGIFWEIPSKKERSDRYGYKIFDHDLNEINTGEYELPFEGRFSEISEHYLSNTGDYFICVKEFKKSERISLTNHMDYKAMHILHATEDGIEDFELNLEGKRVEAMTMNSDNQRILTLTGVYGDNNIPGVSGIFYVRANFDSQEVVDQGFEPFGKDFITQDWTERQRDRSDRRIQRGRSEPQLYNYVMRQSEVLEDGSIVGSLEQYFVQVYTYTDPRTGTFRQTFTYYYNDIIAFKIGPIGGFDWLKRINKYQVSTNDYGPFSSYARYINNGKLCFIFNDNNKNYDEFGNYIDKDNLFYPASFGKRRNAVAIVEIDLIDGDVSRKTFFDREEITALAVPKLFKMDYQLHEMLMYAVYGRKERFGILPLKD
jgi:hypothetical protein